MTHYFAYSAACSIRQDWPDAPQPTEAALAAASPVFDLASALARFGGEHKMLERFLRLFRERNSSTVAAIGVALAQPDVLLARRLAHTLNGSAGTVGLLDLQCTAQALEKALGVVLADARALLCCDHQFFALEQAWQRAQVTLAVQLDSHAEVAGPWQDVPTQ